MRFSTIDICPLDFVCSFCIMADSTHGKWDVINNGTYRLIRKIGSGSFGTIYLGLNTKTGEVSLEFMSNMSGSCR